MKQYLQLLHDIKEKGTHKPPAREGMPGSTSLFGYQNRYDLSEGFPILTTKKMFWKGIVTELLWFLRGDTNIKYLVDNGVNIWNEDAYNYYLKKSKDAPHHPYSYEQFIEWIKNKPKGYSLIFMDRDGHVIPNYQLGDCGYQYGKVWRDWEAGTNDGLGNYYPLGESNSGKVDQIEKVINSLKNNPEGRRHIVTAIDPAHDKDLALYWCHALFQFNCRPLDIFERDKYATDVMEADTLTNNGRQHGIYLTEEYNVPRYYLDCQLYQRSADAVLGVPFNISSYALLIHIVAKICNMVPGEFIHTFGDVHIYDNHMDAVEKQLQRSPDKLPKLVMNNREELWRGVNPEGLELSFDAFIPDDFKLEGYNPQSVIKAELSTGMKK